MASSEKEKDKDKDKAKTHKLSLKGNLSSGTMRPCFVLMVS